MREDEERGWTSVLPDVVAVTLPGHVVRAVAYWADWAGSTAEKAIENLCRDFLASQERFLGNDDMAAEWLDDGQREEGE